MTVFGVSLTSRPAWLVSVVVGVVALVVVLLASGVGARAASAELECDLASATFGEPITCVVTGDDTVDVRWGDGSISTGLGAHVHAPAAVGPVEVTVVDGDTVLASHLVDITPDIAIECEYGLPHPVYELAEAAPDFRTPYDYVYLADDGTKLYPGDATYPTDFYDIIERERAVVEEAPIVGLCSAVSDSLDALDGSVSWMVTSPWYEPKVTMGRRATPGVPGHWEGVQPIDVELRIEINGYEASERIGVYFGGCG
ncbi:MAG: hypothetical protein AAGC53_03585 [Actinomycetota bacterium]